MVSASATHPQSLLILGGTSWLGGAVAAQAVSRGHRVTCLARGESGSVPPGAEHVVADRWQDGAYDAVRDRDWDVVLDVTWQPELVHGATAALATRAAHWIYVSSCSVYSDDRTPHSDESAPLHEAWAGSGVADMEGYGPAKVACEEAVRTAVGDERALVCRPGLIAGYGDPSDRFGYWPARVARMQDAEEVLLAPPLDAPVQVIDVRDLTEWLVAVIEAGTTGVFNAVGDTVSVADVIAACAAVTGHEPVAAEASDAWLAEHEVAPWMGPASLPLWLPQDEYAGFMTRRNDAARTAGLVLRPLRETAAAALDWERERGLGRERRAGLTPERELALLTELLELVD